MFSGLNKIAMLGSIMTTSAHLQSQYDQFGQPIQSLFDSPSFYQMTDYNSESSLIDMIDVSDGDTIITQQFGKGTQFYAFYMNEVQNAILDGKDKIEVIGNDKSGGEEKSKYNLQFKVNEKFETDFDHCKNKDITPSFGFVDGADECQFTMSSVDLKSTIENEGKATQKVNGFTLTYTSFENNCDGADGKDKYKIKIFATCNTDKNAALPFKATDKETDKCTSSFEITDPSVCAHDWDITKAAKDVYLFIGAFFQKKSTKLFLGGAIIISGLVMMLLGTKLIEWITAFLIFLTLTIASMAFCCLIVLHASISLDKFILSLIFSVVLAGVATYFGTKKFVKLGVGALGAWTLLTISFLVVPLFHLGNDSTGNSIKLAIYIILGIVGGLLGIYKSEAVKVYLTSFIGAFFFIRGIAMYGGGFPNEFAIIHGEKPKIEPIFYGYCVGILIFFVFSFMFQKKFVAESNDQGDDEKNTEGRFTKV